MKCRNCNYYGEFGKINLYPSDASFVGKMPNDEHVGSVDILVCPNCGNLTVMKNLIKNEKSLSK